MRTWAQIAGFILLAIINIAIITGTALNLYDCWDNGDCTWLAGARQQHWKP